MPESNTHALRRRCSVGNTRLIDGRGLRLLLLDGGQRLAAQALELLLRERRIQQHVGVEIERLGSRSLSAFMLRNERSSDEPTRERRAERLRRDRRSPARSASSCLPAA